MSYEINRRIMTVFNVYTNYWLWKNTYILEKISKRRDSNKIDASHIEPRLVSFQNPALKFHPGVTEVPTYETIADEDINYPLLAFISLYIYIWYISHTNECEQFRSKYHWHIVRS